MRRERPFMDCQRQPWSLRWVLARSLPLQWLQPLRLLRLLHQLRLLRLALPEAEARLREAVVVAVLLLVAVAVVAVMERVAAAAAAAAARADPPQIGCCSKKCANSKMFMYTSDSRHCLNSE